MHSFSIVQHFKQLASAPCHVSMFRMLPYVILIIHAAAAVAFVFCVALGSIASELAPPLASGAHQRSAVAVHQPSQHLYAFVGNSDSFIFTSESIMWKRCDQYVVGVVRLQRSGTVMRATIFLPARVAKAISRSLRIAACSSQRRQQRRRQQAADSAPAAATTAVCGGGNQQYQIEKNGDVSCCCVVRRRSHRRETQGPHRPPQDH